MSRFHPAWPSPLLALDPIRLRPMGWLDDLLPMRPPSLWRDRSLYARALRWQPDMADLSWLFDAYAMLGIEMPPPRIEHRTHQRSPQRGRLKGGAQPTHLRRRRAPVKGGKRPLAIPRWSSPPQMVAPRKGETQERVDTSPAFRARRQVTPSSLPQFQWRSPDRSAPTPSFSRPNQAQLAPSLGAQPTLLRKEESSPEIRKASVESATENVVSKRKEQPNDRRTVAVKAPQKFSSPEVLAPRKPKVQPFPIDSSSRFSRIPDNDTSEVASRPPKVTWQREHVRSPWRLNHTGKTLLNPTVSIVQPEAARGNVQGKRATSSSQNETPAKKRLAEQVVRIGRPVVKATPESSEKLLSAPRQTGFEQVEWSNVRKGTIQPAVMEQGKIRTVQPAVQMELPPSPRIVSDVSPQTIQKSQSETPVKEETAKKASVRSDSVQAVSTTKTRVQQATVSSEVVQKIQTGIVESPVQPKPTPQVRVPTRVPWRLSPSSPTAQKVSKTTIDSGSVNEPAFSAKPIAERTPSLSKPSVIPRVQSWFRPERQRLIAHFQQQPTQAKVSAQQPDAQPRIKPNYGFTNPVSLGSKKGVFRATEQTMVMPLQAGTMVFPTPSVSDLPAKVSSTPTASSVVDKVQDDKASTSIKSKQSQTVEESPAKVSSRKIEYPKPKVQTETTYQRRVVGDGARWRLPKNLPTSTSTPTLTQLLESQAQKTSWRRPQLRLAKDIVSPISRPESTVQSTKGGSVVGKFRAPTTFWQGSFQRTGLQTQTALVYPTVQIQSAETVPKRTSASVEQPTVVSKKQASSQSVSWMPKQIQRARFASPVTERASKSVSRDALSPVKSVAVGSQESQSVRSVSWSRKPRFPDPFVAQRRAILSATPMQTLRVSDDNISVTEPSSTTSPQRDTQTPTSSVTKQSLDRSVIPKASRQLRSPDTALAPVRRVVAPTLSSSLVYNALSVSPSAPVGHTPSVGKYAATSAKSNADALPSQVAGSTNRVQPTGKYGKRLNPSTVADVSGIDTANDATLSIVQEQDTIPSVDRVVTAEEIAETIQQAVEKQTKALVRRLPTAQQSLLRSRIALPTQWARRLGLGPTADTTRRWRLQPSERSVVSSTTAPTTLMTSRQTQQLVIPNTSTASPVESVNRVSVQEKEEPTKVQTTSRPTQTVSAKASLKPLSNAQINRIIERQVSFFRTASRQSFLKASQMTIGGGGAPAPARQGLQQITGDMRKALQKMVYSADTQPVFLDTFSESMVDKAASIQTSGKYTATANATTSTTVTPKTNPKRLLQRTPRWRPGVHRPSTVQRQASRPSLSPNAQSSTPSVPTLPTEQTTLAGALPNQTIEERSPSRRSSPETVVDTKTNSPIANAPKNRSQPQGKYGRTSSPVAPRLAAGRRSATMVPSALMKSSDVGVFLQPKRKEPEVKPPPKPIPQVDSPSTIDTEADVFMVDASGNLLSGASAKKRLKELGFARSEPVKAKPKKSTPSSGSYTWEAPKEMMEEAVKQVRKEIQVEQKVRESSKPKATPVRQSVIKEWTEEQLLTILVELAGSSPEASALLRDVQERVEEYFDLERFRKI